MSAALPPPDERNPLARALDASSEGPEARAYAVPVEAVRAGARRRRARRAGGAAAAAVVVVAAVVGGSALAGLPRGGNTGLPGPDGTGGTSAADWPAQFTRCGKPADEVLPDVGGKLAISLDGQTESMPADGEWHGAVTAALMPPNDGLGPAHVWPTDVTVVSDGVVVGVQAGGGAPDLAQLGAEGDVLAGDTVDLPTTTQVDLRIASCDPYPSGQGSPDLAPGTYQLVVTQTVSYGGGEGRRVDERDSTTTTLAVTDATGAVPDATACSTSDDLLAALADPQANPQAFPLDVETTGEALVGQPLPMAFSIPEGAADFLGDGLVMSKVQAVLTQGHAVVGQAEQAGGGASLTFGVPHDCSPLGPPREGSLPAGDYEVWVVLDVHPTGPATQDVRVAAGPWPVTIEP